MVLLLCFDCEYSYEIIMDSKAMCGKEIEQDSEIQEPSLGSDWTGLVFGCLEIVRRCIWNVFRMENEQVNNCGKFRATLEVPLPFPDL